MIVSATLLAGIGCKPVPQAATEPTHEPAAANPGPAASAEPPELAPFPEEGWVVERLDPQEAAAQAKAAGLRATVSLPSPVKCPPLINKDPSKDPLAASGPLAGLLIDFDGFLRADLELAQAVAHFGAPAVCTNIAARDLNYHVVPRDRNIRGVSIHSDNFAVRSVYLYFEEPVTITGAELTRRYGAGKDMVSGPHDPFKDRAFEVTTNDFRGTLIVGRAARDDSAGKMSVGMLVLRRTPLVELLPDTFEKEGDLVRLATLALLPGPVSPVRFYGSIGVKGGEDGEHVYFTQVAPRNIAHAALRRTATAPHATRSITVKFERPIALGVESFAEALAEALGAERPVVVRQSTDARIQVRARDKTMLGEVVLRIADQRVTAIELTRIRGPRT